MAELSPKPQGISPSQARLQEALSQIGGEIEDHPLKSSSLTRIMRETFGGSDASGAWDWRMQPLGAEVHDRDRETLRRERLF
jgi:hypothetical protein